MIILGIVERIQRPYFGCYPAVTGLVELGLVCTLGSPRCLLLRVAAGIDSRSVLGACVVALTHPLGRIVRFPEHCQQPVVGDNSGVEHHEHDLGMACEPAAHFLIRRVRSDTARVSCGRAEYAPGFPEAALGAPEATEPEHGLLQFGCERSLERVAVHVVRRRNRHGGVATRQGLIASGEGGLLVFTEHIRLPGSVRRDEVA